MPTAAPRRQRTLPDLHALEAFVAVCESGSMALAAQRLNMSQSSVSQLVKSLEQEYGSALLDRDVRPARTTSAGRVLLARASTLLTQARAMKEQVRIHARQEYAEIRLGCVDSFAATVGPDLIRALSASARQIRLWSGLTPTLCGQLEGRELDFAICTDWRFDKGRIIQRLLFSESWVAVYPKAQEVRELSSARELATLAGDLPLIRYSQRSVIGRQIERYLLHVGLRAPHRFEFDATDPLLSLVAAGLGWALSTPLCLLQSRQYLGDVNVLPLPAARLGQRDFFLLTREGEWTGLEEEIVQVTRAVLQQDTLPAIRRLMPTLPEGSLGCLPEEAP